MHHLRESIFVGALRSFCTSFAAIVGVLLGLILIGVAFLVIAGPNYLPPKSEPMIMPDSHGDRALLPGNTPAILRIDIHGVIGMGDLTAEKIQNVLLDSREDLLKGDRVKAVLLHMNTPGGTVTDADAIYRALLAYKAKFHVPIYAYVDGLCASGGMYIASAADKIFSSPVGVIGSVGVILGPNFNFSEAMTKYGIASLTLTEGKDKDALNPFRPWKPGEQEPEQAILASLYDRFVSIVTTARPNMSREKLINDYGAHIFVAKEAQKFGYIDVADSDYAHALTALAQAAGIGETDHYQVVLLMPPHPLIPGLAQSMLSTGTIKHTIDLPGAFSSELSGKPLYLYSP